jgi:sugar phosphate isomerase/epimerase
MTNRRAFLRRATYAGAGMALSHYGAGRAQAALAGQWGVQLYTLRSVLPSQPFETLKAVAAMGYEEVEIPRAGLNALAPVASEVGLGVTGVHLEAPVVTGDWTAWKAIPGASSFLPPESYGIDAAIADAKAHGVRFLSLAYLMPQERSGLDFYRRYVDSMNRAGEKCKAAGLELCHHNHAFEFQPVEGRVPMDLLVAGFDPKLVNFEIDVFWVSMAGRDPVATMRQLGPRVRLLHLKDRAKDAPAEFQEQNVKPGAFVEVGSGVVDFPGVLAAGRSAGVAHAFVEQDQVAGDPLDSVKKSYAYLAGLKS